MNIEQKMQEVIDAVFPDKSYKVTVINDYSFQAVSPWESWFRDTTSDLKSHWRQEIRKLIMIIIDKKINKALNEV